MSDLTPKRIPDTGQLEILHQSPAATWSLSDLLVHQNSDIQAPGTPIERLLDFDQGAATTVTATEEDDLNQRRLQSLQEELTTAVLNLIRDEHFEYGMGTKADVLVKDQLSVNRLATKSWLNSIFVENFHDPAILVGLLRVIARLDYLDICPEGPIMALAALAHANTQVQECGIRAFESWATVESLHVLQNVTGSTRRLQQYIAQVIKDLRKEHNVTVGSKD